MRLMLQKLYERQLREDQICKPNISKLGHQNYWKNTENTLYARILRNSVRKVLIKN